MDIEHERKIITHFFKKNLQKRLLYEITTPEKRGRIFDRLSDRPETALNKEYMYPIEFKGGKGTEELLEMLMKRGALPQTCYVMSRMSDLDGKYVPLREAIKETVYDGMPFILSCIPGQLAYFEGEQSYGPPPRYILERRSFSK